MSLKTIFHLLAASQFWYGCYYDWHYVKLPIELSRNKSFEQYHKLKFLTYWDALLQAVFFTLCLINDIVGSNENILKKTPFLRKLRNLILSCLAFPLSMFVGLTFWGLYMIDRELIFPQVLDNFFPNWLNHLMHTNIMVFILIEMFTTHQQYPTRKTGLTILSIFMITYLIWIHYIYFIAGTWVYPVLNVLNFPFRIVFFIVLLILSNLLYVFGETLNEVYWKRWNLNRLIRQKRKH